MAGEGGDEGVQACEIRCAGARAPVLLGFTPMFETDPLGDETTSPDGPGQPDLEGYLYQLDVSLWAALDLLLVKRRTDQVVVEPTGDEDLEADLAADDPGPVETGATLALTRLILQAKHRNTGPWSLAEACAACLGRQRATF